MRRSFSPLLSIFEHLYKLTLSAKIQMRFFSFLCE
jgi:hypothetical protein